MVPSTLAHYRIVRPVGAGGMGEIYLAEDTKLGRQVALKVLAPALAGDPERRDRFEREARAVAALNHPNIVTLHSVEQEDGVLFLTMELVEGKALTDLIPRQGMTVAQLLEVAIPLADAIAAAHQRGITHRDLKPANVMVSDEGRVKVLDFGLAKLQEDSPLAGDTAMTAAQLTGEGRIMGTFVYMSPEQAQGRPVDTRSDIFSLGVLLSEMATGERPFKGDNPLSVLSAILKDTPASVTELRQDLPRDLARILGRCLAKDPEERYQTAKDLRNDLRRLVDDLATGIARPDEARGSASQTTSWTRTGPVARPRLVLRAAIVVLAAVAASAGAWWYLRRPPTTASQPFASIQMRRLTNTGNVADAAISPDGRYVVHVVGPFDTPSVWIRQVSTASNVQIVPPTQGSLGGLTFTPDGESVLYLLYPENAFGSLFQIPLLGGPARKLVDDLDTVPGFSPDGRHMAFVRMQSTDDYAIVIANADGTGQRMLAERRPPATYAPVRVAWSPDGSQIAAFVGAMPRQRSRIVLVDVATGKDRDLTAPQFDFPGQLAWLPDASALVFNAVGQGGGFGSTGQLWLASYPDGAVRRLTNDVANYSSVAATRDGRTLAAVQHDERAGLWVAPNGDAARARPIGPMSGSRDGLVGIEWTPDGRVLYASMAQGSWDLWITDANGRSPRQLTNDPGVEAIPRMLPDGKSVGYIAYNLGTAAEHRFQIRAVDLDGGNPREFSADGVQPGYLQVAEGTSTSGASRAARRSFAACRSMAVRPSRCSGTRPGCRPTSGFGWFPATGAGSSGPHSTPGCRECSWRWCPLTSRSPCARSRSPSKCRPTSGSPGRRLQTRSTSWSFATA